MNAKTPPERRAVPQSGAARLSKNIVSKDNKSIAAKHGSLSFARNRTSPFGADMPQSVISAPTLSHNRAISPRHRPPPQCGGGRWRGKSIDIKKQTETALVCKKTMFSIIFTIRCKYAAAQPIHAISYSFTKHRPSPHQTGSGEAVAVCLETIFRISVLPRGRPPLCGVGHMRLKTSANGSGAFAAQSVYVRIGAFYYFHFWSISRSFRFARRAMSSTVSTGMPPRSATYAGDLFRSSADITSRSSSGRYIRL